MNGFLYLRNDKVQPAKDPLNCHPDVFINSQTRQIKKCTHRDRSHTLQHVQSDERLPTLKQVKLYIPWVLEFIFFRRGREQEKRRVEKNYLWSNEPEPHFHTMYEKRYLDHQTGFLGSRDVYFDS